MIQAIGVLVSEKILRATRFFCKTVSEVSVMFNRRRFLLGPLLAAIGSILSLAEPTKAGERHSVGLAAPTSPQGASGGWPINSPDGGIRLSGAGGIDIQDFIHETELLCLVRTKDGGVWCGTIKRIETFGGNAGTFGDDFPGDFYIVPEALRRF